MSNLDHRVQAIIAHAYDRAPATRARLERAGVRPADIRTAADLDRIPVLTKDEAVALQAVDPPFGGMLAAPLNEATHLFFSPGPLYEPAPEPGDSAWDAAVEALRRGGFAPGDVVLNSLSYHLTPAGHYFDRALRLLGATVIPAGTGNSDLQLQLARDLGATGYVGTPSFLLSLIRKAEEAGSDFRRDYRVVRALTTAEPLPPALRGTLVETYGLAVCNAYATAEFGVLATNTAGGMAMSLLSEPVIQVVDPETGRAVAAGEAGEVVVTNFSRYYPLIRYGTGDLAVLVDPRPGESAQEERAIILVGRRGEAVKVRGLFVHPNQLRFAVAQVPGVSAFQAVVTRPDGMRDHLLLRVVLDEGTDPAAAAEALKAAVQAAARVRVDEVEVGSIASEAPPVDDRREWL
jgi:phenylacetate-CoA ligase